MDQLADERNPFMCLFFSCIENHWHSLLQRVSNLAKAREPHHNCKGPFNGMIWTTYCSCPLRYLLGKENKNTVLSNLNRGAATSVGHEEQADDVSGIVRPVAPASSCEGVHLWQLGVLLRVHYVRHRWGCPQLRFEDWEGCLCKVTVCR